MIVIMSAVIGHAEQLAGRLRKADLREIEAAAGEEPLAVLTNGIACSDPCYTVSDGCHPLAIFGVVPDACIEGVGRIWFLGADDLRNHSFTFIRHSRRWVARLHERYPVLWNYIDARNDLHIRWLRWCGFTLLRRIEDYGVARLPFYEFERDAGGHGGVTCCAVVTGAS